MDANRPQKKTVRRIWVDLVTEVSASANEMQLLYVTLCGEEGRDLLCLARAGVLQLTESGALEDQSARRIAAVEKSPLAANKLNTRIPGLKVYEKSIEALVASDKLTSWPTDRKEKEVCCARVINLDFNQKLDAVISHSQLRFPLALLVEKLSILHAQTDFGDWLLFLTLNGTVEWSQAVSHRVGRLLSDNLVLFPGFGPIAEQLLGAATWARVHQEGNDADFAQNSASDQQRLLMALVPNVLARSVAPHGWRLVTERNLCYGGQGDQAAMVAFIFRLVSDQRAIEEPNAVYSECLAGLLNGAGQIEEDGAISPFSD